MTDQPHETHPEVPATPLKRFARTRRWGKRLAVGGVVAAALLFAGSCIHMHKDNAAYPATTAEISAEHTRMKKNPVGVDRPVIVLSGYRSPAGASGNLARRVRKLTGGEADQFHAVSYMMASNIETPADVVVKFVEDKYPSDDPIWTTEVDVIAISMGGLVARLAAADPELRADSETEPPGKRLNIHTLFTLASPHQGSILADFVAIDRASVDMVPGSEFLATLDTEFENASYEIVPYAVLRDGWVGAKHSAPVGQEPIWVSGRLIFSHHMVSLNRRIQADLARRLRGEEPLGGPSEPPRN